MGEAMREQMTKGGTRRKLSLQVRIASRNMMSRRRPETMCK